MAETPVIIELGGQKFIRTADMKVLTLNRTAVTGSAKSMRTLADADYQVPVGKVYKALEFKVQTQAGGSGVALVADEPTVNTQTNANRVFETSSYNGNTMGANMEYDFAAGQYIGCQSVTSSVEILITGLEMNA